MKASKNRSRRFSTQRVIQTASLLLFLYLLSTVLFPLSSSLPGTLPAELFLRLDPLVALAIPVSARELIGNLVPGLLVLLSAIFFGRVFCGYLCPFGTTLDFMRILLNKIFGTRPRRDKARAESAGPVPGGLKYLLLAIILGSAVIGVNQSHWLAPIPLITRFYALLLHPLLLLAAKSGLEAAKTLATILPEEMNPAWLQYMQIPARHFYTLYFLLLFFASLFWLERLKPRFWCSRLCPAGALLSLLDALPRRLFPFLPRWGRMTSACINCGSCAAACPTGAIEPAGEKTRAGECIACRHCAEVCPAGAVRFGFSASSGSLCSTRLPSRRFFLAGAGAGVLLSGTGLSGTGNLLKDVGQGSLWSSSCIRPPGSLPEPDFLKRCLRCGECMKACPSNGLQPTWFAAGVDGAFSPILIPRRGPCEPDCNVCGLVCPTGAIQALALPDKQQAKLGTAVVMQERCLAYAEGKRCVVCQEVCPYGSIRLEQPPGRPGAVPSGVPAPVVNPVKCFGCGYCEHHCPVRIPAVVVYPLNALRFTGTNYRQLAQQAGLELNPVSGDAPPEDYAGPPDNSAGGLPPGFTE